MKKLILVLAAGIFFAACGESKKTAEETQEVATASSEAVTYAIDPAQSSVKWFGEKKITGSHNGTVQLTNGSLSFEGENLTAGNFTIDMTTIKDLDLPEGEDKTNLETHLKSGDFFEVETYATSTFNITAVEKLEGSTEGTHKITGNLTIKGQTHGVSFPATITTTETGVNAAAKIVINRNEWGIVWGGTKETNQKTLDYLKDNLLKDEITFEVALVGTK
ncbi:MAG TPA: hypothetical protein DIW47_14045 [Bacteroidetes bacterium]|nr:hypothetical protein [Bacteroidota bacterium]